MATKKQKKKEEEPVALVSDYLIESEELFDITPREFVLVMKYCGKEPEDKLSMQQVRECIESYNNIPVRSK